MTFCSFQRAAKFLDKLTQSAQEHTLAVRVSILEPHLAVAYSAWHSTRVNGSLYTTSSPGLGLGSSSPGLP